MGEQRNTEAMMSIGAAWYKRGQWGLLKSVSSDADELEDSYDEWLEYAERSREELEKRGVKVVKITVDVRDIVAWCRSRGCPVDGRARAAFVAHKIEKQKEC